MRFTVAAARRRILPSAFICTAMFLASGGSVQANYAGSVISLSCPAYIGPTSGLPVIITVTNGGSSQWPAYIGSFSQYYPSYKVIFRNMSWTNSGNQNLFNQMYHVAAHTTDTRTNSLAYQYLPHSPGTYTVTVECLYHTSTNQNTYTAMLNSPTQLRFTVTSTDPTPLQPRIEANGSEGPVTVSTGMPVSVRISMSPGVQAGVQADWWVLAKTGSGSFYSYDRVTRTWKPGIKATFQAALTTVSWVEVLNSSSLPVGSYTFYFAVDTLRDGLLQMDRLTYDSVQVMVQPGMALIPAGSFVMGNSTNVFPASEGDSDELPQHTIHLSAFYMDEYEVSKALWDAVATWASTHGYDLSASSGRGSKAANHPVPYVSWYECVKWCNARSEQAGLTPCYTTNGLTYKMGNNSNVICNWSANGYRLPTEAEWEKAARGGDANHRFPWSDTNTIQHGRANYHSNAFYSYDTSPTRGYHPTFFTGEDPYTSPVGSFPANGYGLHDMAGNVGEWCWDWYDSNYYTSSPGTDPRGAEVGSMRVQRGGWYSSDATYTRVTYRSADLPEPSCGVIDCDGGIGGFRCVRGL